MILKRYPYLRKNSNNKGFKNSAIFYFAEFLKPLLLLFYFSPYKDDPKPE